MTWLPRRPSVATDDPGATSAFATEFASLVDRSFPIDDAALVRMRAQVLGVFIEGVSSSGLRRGRGVVRRGIAFGLAGSLAVAAFGAVAVEARPGGAFYPVSLAIESATLAAPDVPEGWQARLDRLQRRIDEAMAADQAGDVGAITATLTEYRAELAGMTAGLGDPTRRSALVSALPPDLIVVLGLERTHPSEIATQVIADLRSILGPIVPTIDQPIDDGSVTGGPAIDAPTPDHPGDDQTTGNPHADGTTGNPHADGTTGNPHADGTTSNPHAGTDTGNGNDPHATSKAGKPPADPHAGNGGRHPNAGTDAPGRTRTKG